MRALLVAPFQLDDKAVQDATAELEATGYNVVQYDPDRYYYTGAIIECVIVIDADGMSKPSRRDILVRILQAVQGPQPLKFYRYESLITFDVCSSCGRDHESHPVYSAFPDGSECCNVA